MLKAKIRPLLPLEPSINHVTEIQLSEENRIREAYAQRRKSTQGTYSFFNPSYVLHVQERESELLCMLAHREVGPLETRRILEIGCGTGHWLRAFMQWGAQPENVFGVDLLPDRIEQARRVCPEGVRLECGNATALNFPDATFDLVLQSTVFTSILDLEMKDRIAIEMLRVLKPGGFVIWYDFFVDNPRNPDVRGVRKSEIHRLFPGCQIDLRQITLAPPIGRLVARYSPLVYMLLSRTKILCTHYLGLIKKC